MIVSKHTKFDDLIVSLVKNGNNLKLKTWLSPVNVFNIYITHADKYASWLEYELKVCSNHCEFRSDKQGGCYVKSMPFSVNSVRKSKQSSFSLLPGLYSLRATAHGDIDRLNDEGRQFILDLLANAHEVRGYTAGWRSPEMQPFKPYLMASSYDQAARHEAKSLGWNTYRYQGSNERAERGEYACTVLGDKHSSERLRGCFNCKTPCAGAGAGFDVISPDKQRILERRA